MRDLVEHALALCPKSEEAADDERADDDDKRVKVAIVGRPNVGKSTLVNTLLGEDRVIAFDEPGTTRDSLYLDFDRGGRHYTLIDTAGVRKRGKVTDVIEKFSVIKTLQAIEDANVVMLLLDAQADISEQDAHIAGYILEAGRALVVAVNKWDGLSADARANDQARTRPQARPSSPSPSSTRFRHATARASRALLKSIDEAYAAAMSKLPTPKLTRALADRGRSAATAARRHGAAEDALRASGRDESARHRHPRHRRWAPFPRPIARYLEHFFLDVFKLQGTPLRIQFKTGANPYAAATTPRRSQRQVVPSRVPT